MALDFDTIFYTLNKVRPAKEPGTGRNVGWTPGRLGLAPQRQAPPDSARRRTAPGKSANSRAPKGRRSSMPASGAIRVGRSTRQGVMSRGRGQQFDQAGLRQRPHPPRVSLRALGRSRVDRPTLRQLRRVPHVRLRTAGREQLREPDLRRRHVRSDLRATPAAGERQPQAGRVAVLRHPHEGAGRSPQDGSVEEPLRATIFHNGVLIQDDVWVYGEVGKAYQRSTASARSCSRTTRAPRSRSGICGSSRMSTTTARSTSSGKISATPRPRLVEPETESAPAKPPITILPSGMVEGNGQGSEPGHHHRGIRRLPRGAIRSPRQGQEWILSTTTEFPHRNALKGADKNNDGKLSRAEHSALFRGQFPNVDLNGDGVITGADKRRSRGERNRKKKNAPSESEKESSAHQAPGQT